MLALALHNHPDAVCFGEIFRGNIPAWRRPGIKEYINPFAPASSLNAMLRRYDDKKAVGFKLMFRHSKVVRHYVAKRPEWRKILLLRENLLASYSSFLFAKKSRKGVALKGSETIRARVSFNRKQFERFCLERERALCEVERDLKDDVLVVEYADISRNGLGRVLSFLGLDGTTTAGTLKRQSSNILNRFVVPETVSAYLDEIGKPQWAHEASGELR